MDFLKRIVGYKEDRDALDLTSDKIEKELSWALQERDDPYYRVKKCVEKQAGRKVFPSPDNGSEDK